MVFGALTARPSGRPAPGPPARRPGRPRPARRSSPGCRPGPGSPEEAKPSTDSPSSSRANRPTATSAPRRSSGERTTPPRPTRPRPTSNWGLTSASRSNRSATRRHHRGQHLGQRDERHVDHHQVGRIRQLARLELARVAPLDHRDARVLPQPPAQLAVSYVQRGDAGGAALQQAVGESARRGADVQAAPGRRGRARRRRARWRA